MEMVYKGNQIGRYQPIFNIKGEWIDEFRVSINERKSVIRILYLSINKKWLSSKKKILRKVFVRKIENPTFSDKTRKSRIFYKF